MADVRVTQQTAEVLGAVTGELRVTQQYIEYLREYNDGFITSVATITDSVLGTTVRNRSVSDDIFFFERVDAAGVPLSEEIIHNFSADVITYDPATGEYRTVHEGLGDFVGQTLIGIKAQDNLLTLSQDITYVYVKAAGTADSITSSLTLTQTVVDAWGGDTTSTITFGQTIGQEVGRGTADDFTITQTIAETRIANGAIVSTVGLGDIVEFTKNETDSSVLCTYTPFVGVTSDVNAPDPPPIVSPTLIPLDQVTLTCPAASTTITLRNPERGDKDVSGFQRINRETRGGTLVVFSDPIWPRTQKLILEFTGLTEAKGQEFLTFLNLALGQYVELTDWDSNTWGGILTAPQDPIVRDGLCKVFATVEFEGGRLSLQTITDTLAVTDTVGEVSTIHTLWAGNNDRKLYFTSGQFTSTLKDSESVTAKGRPVGIEWDGTDTMWGGADGGVTKSMHVLQSGRFTSTIKQSFDIGVWATDQNSGTSWDGTDTLWVNNFNDKLMLDSGRYSSTVHDSQATTAIDIDPRDISYDGTNTPWVGWASQKLYLQSGVFSSTLQTSESIGGVDANPYGISWDGTNTPWAGTFNDKLILQSGQFTSTIKTSFVTTSVDSNPAAITNNNKPAII